MLAKNSLHCGLFARLTLSQVFSKLADRALLVGLDQEDQLKQIENLFL